MQELHSWPLHLTADLRQKLLDDKMRRAQHYWQAQEKIRSAKNAQNHVNISNTNSHSNH